MTRAHPGYRSLPQRNGKAALVKMPTKRKRHYDYGTRRAHALGFVLNLVRKYDLWRDVEHAEQEDLAAALREIS